MITAILCLLILISSIASIAVDVKRIKAVKENTKAYKELEKTTISIDKLTDEVIKKIAVKSIRDINKLIANERKGVN